MKKAKMSPRDEASFGPRQLKDPNSPAFAWQTISLLKTRYQSKTVSEKNWRETLEEAEKHRIYERVPEEKPYGTLDAMLQAEIGVTAEESIKRFQAQATKQGERRNFADSGKLSQSDRAKVNGVGKDTQRYLDRLAKDHPALLDKVNAGELKPYAAAKQAGIVRVLSALEVALKAFGKLSPREQKEFFKRTGLSE